MKDEESEASVVEFVAAKKSELDVEESIAGNSEVGVESHNLSSKVQSISSVRGGSCTSLVEESSNVMVFGVGTNKV